MIRHGLDSRDSVNKEAFKRLLADLRHPPRNYPRFTMLETYGFATNARSVGDITSYLALQSLKTAEMQALLDDKNAIIEVARKVTGLPSSHFLQIEVPLALIKDNYPLSHVTAADAANVVEAYIDSGYTAFDWSFAMPDEDDDDDEFGE